MVKFHSKHVGIYQVTVAFEFKLSKEPSPRPFHIIRDIEAEFSTQLARELGPVKPYTPFRLSRDQSANFTVDEGEQPDKYSTHSTFTIDSGHMLRLSGFKILTFSASVLSLVAWPYRIFNMRSHCCCINAQTMSMT